MIVFLFYICVYLDDNVVIVVNDGGLFEGVMFVDGLMLCEGVL